MSNKTALLDDAPGAGKESRMASARAIEIRRSGLEALSEVAALFNDYRIFYGQSSDPAGARTFLRERMERSQSIVFTAWLEAKAVGFTQLYPSYSSVSMGPILILNDLFVAAEHRRRGVGSALLDAAVGFGREAGAVRLSLTTQTHNRGAQATYERAGWMRDNEFFTYNFRLG